MNKDDILSMLKSQVLALRDQSREIESDKRLQLDWSEKTKFLINNIHGLNSCDMLWLNDEYGKWFDKEISPHTRRINSSLLKQIH